ncbi:MAG: Planctomycete cytochrome [Verrucomicrobiaceae bacterium]|nr:Planctomycete cytochrome [Verrucomicrobiaceae bacterium]
MRTINVTSSGPPSIWEAFPATLLAANRQSGGLLPGIFYRFVQPSSVVLSALFLAAATPVLISAAPVVEQDPARLEFFEKKVRPLLADHCYACHSADTKPAGGLRVDDRNGLLVGGDEGPAIVIGEPENSLLLKRLTHTDAKKRMPKEGDLLTPAEIADLTTWIKEGVAWPREKIPASIGRVRPDYEKLKAEHWAWQPLKAPQVPLVKDSAWPRDNIDRFILSRLETGGLAPVGDANALTLIRRVTYDLTGLPAKPAEIEEFLQDSSRDAFARVVDRLLDSQGFAERWGRHWLDVARYGESTGPSRNVPYPHAWKYRDYVLDAVRKDVPFDRFIQEQIAGDLLPAKNLVERDRLLTATGFLALGVKDVNQRFKVRFIMDNVDEQIDAVTRSVLGLTVNCARCHDHKFDPIPVTDYYALAGIFTSTDDCAGVRNKMGGGGLDYYDPKMLVSLASGGPPAAAEEVQKLQAIADAAKKAFEEIRGTPEGLAKAANGKPKQRVFRQKLDKAQADLLQLTDPAARGFAVHGVRDAKVLGDTEVRIRGEAERIGPTVPRGFLTAFAVPGSPQVNPAQSGRLELAQWLTSPQNPLTPRVMANRIWQHLFGQGLVSTVDNFGINGDRPSHPELLDYLAGEFVRQKWSVKQLVRTLVLTRSYQLGSEAPAASKEQDPANHLVWRHSPRRLDAEEIRDAMLASAGRLQSSPAEASPASALKMIEMRDNGAEARTIHEKADASLSRSVYLPLLRGVVPKSLEAFDPVLQSLVTGQRDATTVPSQALYLLNSSFVRQQSLALADEVAKKNERPDGEWIRQLYLRILGRSPNESESTRASAFLRDYAAGYTGEPAAPSVAKLELAQTDTGEAGNAVAVPANPDDVDRGTDEVKEAPVVPRNATVAAWMNLAQALYASAEFRFVR